ncbi:MAG: thioredoxin domain-containing protein [Armatimonadetes bacterium]|nr:thioredoxin domain-containing protein [Armatimonadota bacterium]
MPNRSANRLINETSPYLQQHAYNPVDWYPWGEEALQRAKHNNKPILLSIGYSACHWCHVMERESFEDENTAQLMNEHFVCIKVDREERPDLDAVYMAAVQMMTGRGGWPMTVFLTPERIPFYGGTYFPPEDRYGMPGFRRVLVAVSEAYQQRRDEVEQQGKAIAGEINQHTANRLIPGLVTHEMLDEAFQELSTKLDAREGGFGGAPKFPQPMILEFLLRYTHRTGRPVPMEMAELTLSKMAYGGIYDQVGGGFHRYSVDDRWLVPHFEKMLYDNAQMSSLYLHAYLMTKKPIYRRITAETLDYLLREMQHPEGGFCCSQDADSNGEEGVYFLWTADEIEAVLEDNASDICRNFDVSESGNFEGRCILHWTGDEKKSEESEANGFYSEERSKLAQARERRVMPNRDDKVLASWNGLVISTLAEAGAALNRSDYLEAATTAAHRLLRAMTSSAEGDYPHLPHVISNYERRDVNLKAPAGFLEDYAFVSDGLLSLFEATGEPQWLNGAVQLVKTMNTSYADPNGGYFNTADSAETLISRPKELMDNAIPAGNSAACEVLLRLSALTGDRSLENIAATYLRSLRAAMARYPSAFGRLLCAADRFIGPLQELVIVGRREWHSTRALLQTARSQYQPNLTTVYWDKVAHLDLPLLEGRDGDENEAVAYLCEGGLCRKPTETPEELTEQLSNTL